MDSEVIRLAIGLNKVRDIVEKQKQRKALSSESTISSHNKLNNDKEFRVFYDLPLRIGTNLSDLKITNNNINNKLDNNSSDSNIRSDNRISAQNNERLNGFALNPDIKSVKLNRKVVISSAFKNINEDIPQWVSPINLFKDNFLRNGLINDNKNPKPLVKKQLKIAIMKTNSDDNEDKYNMKSGSMKSMSNLPLNKLHKLRESAQKQDIHCQNVGKCSKSGRKKPYDVKTIQDWIKQKRLDSQHNRQEVNDRRVREKPYDQKMIRKYMEKQKEIRKKQMNINKDDNKIVKCDQKSYDPIVARKYMIEKKRKLQQKHISDNINSNKSNNTQIDNKSVQNNCQLNCNQVIDNTSLDNEVIRKSITNNSSTNSQKTQSTISKNKSSDSPLSSPTKSPAKGHRRQDPIMNSEHLKEMLTQLINGSGDQTSSLAEYKSLPNTASDNHILKTIANSNHSKPVSVIKMPDYNSLNGSINGSMNGSMSAISCLTNSIATNEELSPLTLSPNSSLFSKSISLKSEDLNHLETNENPIEASIKQVIDRAVVEVPTWEELCERVYRITIKNKVISKSTLDSQPINNLAETPTTAQTSARQTSPVSPNSLKAMEIFPHFKAKTPKTQNTNNQMPKFIEQRAHSLSPQRTPSPVLDSNDSLKSLPSLSSSSSTSSSTSTPSTTKSVTPKQVVVDLSDFDKPLDKSQSISSEIDEQMRNNSELNSYSSNFESMSPSSCSISAKSNPNTSKELSVLERVGKIRKEHNLSNGDLLDTSINKSTKLSQHDLFRLTSDIDDIYGVDEDDATDNVSSIKSEEGLIDSMNESKSQTTSSEKPVMPEMISELNITEFVQNEAIYIFRAKRTKDSIKQLEYRHKNRTPFKLFLFDLCKEITLEEYSFDNDFKITLKLPLKLQKQLWPKTEEQFASLMALKVNKMIQKPQKKPNIKDDGLMAFCRKSKKRDLVDTVLYEEICLEDWRWAYFEPEIVVIKEKITDLIVEQFINEAIHQWKQFNNR